MTLKHLPPSPATGNQSLLFVAGLMNDNIHDSGNSASGLLMAVLSPGGRPACQFFDHGIKTLELSSSIPIPTTPTPETTFLPVLWLESGYEGENEPKFVLAFGNNLWEVTKNGTAEQYSVCSVGCTGFAVTSLLNIEEARLIMPGC